MSPKILSTINADHAPKLCFLELYYTYYTYFFICSNVHKKYIFMKISTKYYVSLFL